jgi:hypothetical protein
VLPGFDKLGHQSAVDLLCLWDNHNLGTGYRKFS